MAAPMKTSMPANVDIGATYTLQIAALNPTTGAPVAGVTVSNVMLEVENVAGGDLTSGVFRPILLRTGSGA
jgi:hypothetical protein